MIFFMWSGNHKFYIQFSRLLRLQSFRITLYKLCPLIALIDCFGLLDINVTKNVHSTQEQIDPARNLKKWKEQVYT
jgi:hypothetical protein